VIECLRHLLTLLPINLGMDIASYGAYKTDWKFPNLTCVINPYVTNVNITYSNTTGLFNATVLDRSDKTLQWSRDLAQVNNWLFRVFTVGTGVSSRVATSHFALTLSCNEQNQIINSIIALQNTPSYERGIYSNVTINWPNTMELLIQGMTEYHATRLRMILEVIAHTGLDRSSQLIADSAGRDKFYRRSTWIPAYRRQYKQLASRL
jgi:hypothetical protein